MTPSRLEAVIEEAAPTLLSYFLRRVDPAEDAADLVGETMIAAWRAARRAPDDAEASRMWLFGVARNVLRHHERSRRRRDALVVRLATAVAVTRPVDDDHALEVRSAVGALPVDLAELVRLVHWDGFTVQDAATLLGISPSTARSRHARAKELLRELLAEPARLV